MKFGSCQSRRPSVTTSHHVCNKYFLKRAFYSKLTSSPLTFQVLVHTKEMQQATTKKIWNMQFHLNSSSFPPSICRWLANIHKSWGVIAAVWQGHRTSGHQWAPPQCSAQSPRPCHPSSSLLSQRWKGCVMFRASAQMQVSADHRPSGLSWSWTTELNSSLTVVFNENWIRSITCMSKQKVRHYKLVSLGRLRTFISSSSRREMSFIFI